MFAAEKAATPRVVLEAAWGHRGLRRVHRDAHTVHAEEGEGAGGHRWGGANRAAMGAGVRAARASVGSPGMRASAGSARSGWLGGKKENP